MTSSPITCRSKVIAEPDHFPHLMTLLIASLIRVIAEPDHFPHLMTLLIASLIRVIAEPGRFFAEASMHLACHVHSVRNRL